MIYVSQKSADVSSFRRYAFRRWIGSMEGVKCIINSWFPFGPRIGEGMIWVGRHPIFEKKVDKIESSNYSGLETAICGYQGVRLALELGEIFGLKWQKVYYSHSGEISGDWSRVVGYTSIIAVKS